MVARIRWSCLLVCVVAASLGASARGGAPSPSLAFGGRIFAVDGGPLDRIRVVATDGRGTYEAIVDTSGVFVGAFPRTPEGRVTLRIFSDSAARYHPSVVTLGPGVPDRPVRIVLIPTYWRITGGPFDGRQVRIDPLQAVSRVGGVAGYWRVTRRGGRSGRPVSWVADSFPVRVAFRREPHDPAISARDSAEFWTLAEELERNLGRTLFRPSSPREIERGADGIFVAIDHGMSAAGRTFITYDESGRIFEALVSVSRREFLGDTRVAMHELLHAIGFGHAGAWASVMGPSTRGISRPTADDVAYAQLYYAISALQRERDVPYGILEAGRDFRF
ncbi:MAG TPA: hypothetical protein VFZ21_32385 [Gemmatimonadaceae bacterium]|nr:hypothetical protein [Gemmatimonadaceae bacterium]